jgi:hypothetical protein
MNWYPLSTKEALLLLLVFGMSGIFSYIQQYFLPPSLLPFTYIFFIFLLLLAFFPIARPANPLALAKFLSLILGVIYTAMIVLREFIIRHNYSWHSAIVIAGVIVSPLIAGWLYTLVLKR